MVPVCAPAAPRLPSTRAQIVALSCACAGFSAFLYAVNPSQHAVYPPCLFHRFTGLYCAGCGATRALYALLHGRFLQAAQDNMLFVAALPLLLLGGAYYLHRAWRSNTWPAYRLQPAQLMTRGALIFAVMILFMIIRNLPGAPFDLLRPLS